MKRLLKYAGIALLALIIVSALASMVEDKETATPTKDSQLPEPTATVALPSETPEPTATFTPYEVDVLAVDGVTGIELVAIDKLDREDEYAGWSVYIEAQLDPKADYDAVAEELWNVASAWVAPEKVMDFDVILWAPGKQAVSYAWSAIVDDALVREPGQWRKTTMSITPEATFERGQ